MEKEKEKEVSTKHFSDMELSCQCGCGFKITDDLFLKRLEYAREYARIPFIITSGARCDKHNKEVGGVADSAHTKGLAVDIAFKNSNQCYKIMDALIKAGFKRIGINFDKSFIHCDADESKPQNVLFKY